MKRVTYLEKITIKDLNLWDENARFPEEYFNKSEKQLIDFLLSRKDFKIESFAKEIVNEFILPQLERIVVYRYRGQNIVLEGNRRIAVYKLLINPSLTSIQNTRLFFEELSRKINIDNSFKLDAVVTTDRDVGLRYIDRKHTKRNNEVHWGEQERHNYKVRRGNAAAKTEVFRYEFGKLVRTLNIPEEMKSAILGKGFVTTFYRLVDSDPALKYLGFKKNDDGTIYIENRKDFESKLKVIIFDVLTKREINGQKLDSRFLNKTDAKEKYLSSITLSDKKRVESEIKNHITTDIFGQQVFDLKTAKGIEIYNVKARQYRSIIDPTLLLPNVSAEKIRGVFQELQKVDAVTCPTAAALLLRTLMEVTVAEFADKKQIQVDNNDYFRTSNGKTKESLKEKIDYISSKFAPQKVKETVSIFNGNSVFTENLNKIAHSRYIFASKDKVATLWKDSKTFWEFLIEEIIKEEKNKPKS